MNERIRELAEQCYHRYSEHHIDLEKFANLLEQEFFSQGYLAGKSDGIQETVRECADLVDDHDDSYPYVSFGDMIKRHFGVE